MVLKIRLARFGRRNNPFYNVVVAHARTARNSKPLEVLGTYDPIPKQDTYAPPGQKMHKDIKLDITRAKYWVGVGAQPTEPVWRLLSLLNILEPRRPSPTMPNMRRRKPTLVRAAKTPKKPTLKTTTRKEETPKSPTDLMSEPKPEKRTQRPPLELSAALRSAVAQKIAIHERSKAAKATEKLAKKKQATLEAARKKALGSSDRRPALAKEPAFSTIPASAEEATPIKEPRAAGEPAPAKKSTSSEEAASETSSKPKPTSS